ncbi:MAG TPA: STAS domain-containing protein [Terriglobales bacterium]|nr:STAS domain-containing protein [Terriglobales bacterium]
MPLDLTMRNLVGSSVIACHGRIVLGDESAKLRHVVKEALAEGNHIVLDLGGVTHIDSTGLGVLVGLHTSARRSGGDLKLANLNPHLRDVLGMTRLLTIFELFDTAEDAAVTFNPLAGQVTPGEY